MSQLIRILCSDDPEIKNRSIDGFCREASLAELLAEARALERYRREETNLYRRVRALFFLYALHRFYLPLHPGGKEGIIPCEAVEHLLKRRFEEAIRLFLRLRDSRGVNEGINSGLAAAYRQLAFQTLADQVRISVRSVAGNRWMFRIGHPYDQPLQIVPSLMLQDADTGLYPILKEATPVRMDITHSGWSDIFFLGMDFPEGARVLNISIDLCVRDGTAAIPGPPIETRFRVIDEPVIRLTSIDLGASSDISNLQELFDFAKDYLGLLKAAVIASGIVPPGMEGAGLPLAFLLEKMAGKGRGIEIVSKVNNIPRGSRLAVSTNLLASLIALCMRASGQTRRPDGILTEEERRLVAARAILGEWLGGSGGGWQDSGGIWPGIKCIEGVGAAPGDPEAGVSRGRLLPCHTLLDAGRVSHETRRKLQESLVIVHGGMAQDVGPVLEMVTEKYLLRTEKEWKARLEALACFDEVVNALEAGDIRTIAGITHRLFSGPIQDIIPRASNKYTETLIGRVEQEFGNRFRGFWMMGGMSGGGMGFIFDPEVKRQAQERLQQIMSETKREFEQAIPFAMEPVVYDFRINEKGTSAMLQAGKEALMPEDYYTHWLPQLLKKDLRGLSPSRRNELTALGNSFTQGRDYPGFTSLLFDRMIPRSHTGEAGNRPLDQLLGEYGFNREQHEQIRRDLRTGRISLSKNRLPASTLVEDVPPDSLPGGEILCDPALTEAGLRALRNRELAIVTLSGGAGSRWTRGAGVVKSLNPFVKLEGSHRNFLELHLAKTRKSSLLCGQPLQHVVTTSYLTHRPVASYLGDHGFLQPGGAVYLSPGRSAGLRLVPMVRDLRFLWEEMPQQQLDEQSQKVRQSLRNALINWARDAGEGEDYRDNLPEQCIHPVGHWYEIPNLLLNGTLAQLLGDNRSLKHLLVHNADTLGVHADPALFGYHITGGNGMTAEVVTRWLDDRGGGLARINGQLRLVEGIALPDERTEFKLSFYNTNTFWIHIDSLLAAFGLSRDDLSDLPKISRQVYKMAVRMPAYVIIKEVKRRWGKGQEDVFPVTQFEKLWGDMTFIPGFSCGFVRVERVRGQQLKEVAQLDGWMRDGSREYVENLCDWNIRAAVPSDGSTTPAE